MPTPTYTPLAEITLGSSAASVTFSSISQAYRDLVLVIENLSSSGTTSPDTRFNADSGSNYTYVIASGDGTSTASSAATTTRILGAGASTTDRALTTHTIFDYSATDKHKTVLTRRGNATAQTAMLAQRWANTAAITSIVITSSFASGSTFALYGIAA